MRILRTKPILKTKGENMPEPKPEEPKGPPPPKPDPGAMNHHLVKMLMELSEKVGRLEGMVEVLLKKEE